ncbi:MAG TPA: OprD family porin [Pseudomonas sp.]|nr:OprD family porin [Pseudomonas sp.]
MSKSPIARAVAIAALGTSLTLPTLAHAEFVKDSKGSLEMRNFYMNRDFRQDNAAQAKAEEWAQGFLLRMESGYTEGTIGVGVDALGLASIKLDSGDGTTGTGLLVPDRSGGAQDNSAELGVTGKLKLSKSTLKAGTLLPKMPVVQYNDSRLLPQTFQGGLLNVMEIDGLSLNGGQLKQVNDRNSTDYTDMTMTTSEKRGFKVSKRAGDEFNFLGGDYKLTDQLTASYYYGQLEDYYKQHFVGLVHLLPLGDGQSLKTDLRYFDSSDDGDHYVSQVDNRALNGMVTYGIGGHAFGLGYQDMSGDTGFAYLDGTDPFLVNYVQIGNFSSAEERSWQARYDYNFTSLGVPGLTFMTRYVTGDNIDQGPGTGEGKEWERNMDIAYVLQDGALKGLGLKWRNATYRSNFGNDLDENRLILSYTLALW